MKRTTSARELLLSIARGRGTTLRAQLESELRAAIQTGRLPGGTPVPSTRALAADLGVSRGVIVLAYEQLMAEGYLTAARGSATRVVMRRPHKSSQAAAVQPVAAPRYDFRPGLPDVSLFPRRAWLSSLRRVLDAAAADALGYPDPHGALSARTALAAYLNRTRGTVAHAERMVLCTWLRAGPAPGLRGAAIARRAPRRRGGSRARRPTGGHPGDGPGRPARARRRRRPVRRAAPSPRRGRGAGHAGAPVPDRRRPGAGAPGSAARVGGATQSGRHRGRLRRRVPLRSRTRRRPPGPGR